MQAISTHDCLNHPERFLTNRQRRWLRPLGRWRHMVRDVLIAVNHRLMRVFFRLSVTGLDGIPRQGPFILAPNHTSSLDGSVLFAALDQATLDNTRWAGLKAAVLRHSVRRFFNRLAKTVPIERNHTALAVAATVLKRGENLVWFPEGTRTRDGQLQPLKPGVGLLMVHLGVPVVPIYLDGSYRALTPGTLRLRLFSRIEVRIGQAFSAADLELDAPDEEQLDEEQRVDRCVEELRKRLLALRDRAQ